MNNEQTDSTIPQTEPAAPQPTPQPKSTPKPPPAPKQPYVYPPVAPVRRVGTLTMGFALVATGLVALAATFIPNFDLVTVLRLSPVLFVFLGIEVLISCARFKGERIKYDFLSGFVCFLLICGGISLSFVPIMWEYAGPPAMQAREYAEDMVEDDLYLRLRGEERIASYHANTHIPYSKWSNVENNPEDLRTRSDSYLQFELSGQYDSKQAFAADCHRLLAKLQNTDYRIESIHFTGEGDQTYYRVDLRGRFQYELSADAIAAQVETGRVNTDDWDESDELEVTLGDAVTEPTAPTAPSVYAKLFF